MDNAKLAETRQWLIKSQRDLKAAYVLLINNEESLLDAVVYHCQQAAEKALKAYLTYQEQVVKKTHDLDVLLDICSLFEPGFHDLKDIADTLTPYATEFRYPGDVIEPERSEAEEALEMATLVLDFVIQKLPSQFDRE
jgi:HEPN domain-containing protein